MIWECFSVLTDNPELKLWNTTQTCHQMTRVVCISCLLFGQSKFKSWKSPTCYNSLFKKKKKNLDINNDSVTTARQSRDNDGVQSVKYLLLILSLLTYSTSALTKTIQRQLQYCFARQQYWSPLHNVKSIRFSSCWLDAITNTKSCWVSRDARLLRHCYGNVVSSSSHVFKAPDGLALTVA